MSSSDMTNCDHFPLTEVLSFIVDNRGKSVPTVEEGIALIATNCIKNTELYPVFEKVRFLSKDTYDTWFRAHPKPGDIIFVNKGTPGRVCLVPDTVNFCIAQDMMAFRVNKNIIDNKFLFAVLRSPQFQNQIENFHVGTLIPHFKKGDLNKLIIPVPSMEVQKFIGETYYALCNKIELNNRMNKNLEEMAQAIFKSWFVDFEPFQDGEFEESELGMIPKGWRVGTIEDISKEIVCGKTPSTKDKDNFGGDVPFITIPDMHGNVYITKTERYLTNKGVKTQPKKTLPKNSVIVSCIATPGLVSLTSTESQTNQQINSIICKDGIEHYYIYQCMKSFSDKIKDLGSGGSTTLNLNKLQFSKIKLIIPNENSMLKYTQIIEPIFVKILENQKKTSILIETRDTLLPKLMSGEIRVPIEEVQ